jgi:isocitrate lyase
MDVPTIIVARTDANGATLLTSDVDERDRPFLTGERTPEGFHRVTGGLESAISRGLAYAPHADLIWCETAKPDLDEARAFADAIHAEHPGKIATFQKELGTMGYRYQFITLAGFHAMNSSMFELARGYAEAGMPAYVELQEREFGLEPAGYTATRHQREVGAGYFDLVIQVVGGGNSSTLALEGSTEQEQFQSTGTAG